MHSLNMVHRDVKSHNILRSYQREEEGRAVYKMCDFGLVRSHKFLMIIIILISHHPPPHPYDRLGAGTVSYMAPEIFLKRSLSRKVDVYGMGCVIYETFSNSLPFQGLDADDIKSLVIGGTRPQLSHTHPGTTSELLTLVEQCLEEDPNFRPECSEMVEKLIENRSIIKFQEQKTNRDDDEFDSLDALMGHK